MKNYEYELSLYRDFRWISIVSMIFTAVSMTILILEGVELSILKILFLFFLFVVPSYLIIFFFIPKKIMLEKDGIVVKKGFKIKLITSYENIKEIILIENCKKTNHFDGNDVIDYGWGDLLKNKDISKISDIKNAVLIKANKNYLFNIKNAQEFITNLENKIPIKKIHNEIIYKNINKIKSYK